MDHYSHYIKHELTKQERELIALQFATWRDEVIRANGYPQIVISMTSSDQIMLCRIEGMTIEKIIKYLETIIKNLKTEHQS